MSQQINLFNPIFLKQKKIFTALAMAQALGVLVLGLAGFAAYSQVSLNRLKAEELRSSEQLAKRQEQIAAMLVQYPPRKKSPQLEAQLTAAEARLAALKNVSSLLERGVAGNTAGFSGFFRALAQPRVNGLWLTGFTLNGAGDDVVIEGRALQAGLVPQFIGRLAHESQFQGKTFGALNILTPPPKAEAGKNSATLPPYIEFTLQSAPAVEATK
ncbi:MAG TPA: hypothetical protein VFF16_13615 [Telluria sp.]|nr:hypothetical protein [Telluria sp.]